MNRILIYSFLLLNIGYAASWFFQSGKPQHQQSLPLYSPNTSGADTGKVEANYRSFCGGCHGEKMDAFVDRRWKHGSSREDLFKGIKVGYHDEGMPAFDSAFSDKEMYALADYILEGIKNRKKYDFASEPARENRFVSSEMTIKLDTVVRGIGSPWGMTFLPGGDMLVTEKSGKLYRITAKRNRQEIEGVPPVTADGQGGMMDVILHPGFKTNKLPVLFRHKAGREQ